MNEQTILTLTIDLNVYSLSAVKMAAYRIADKCSVNMKKENKAVIVYFVPLKDRQLADGMDAVFLRELNDQELRTTIRSETADIRKLIIAQAFSKTDFLGGDE